MSVGCSVIRVSRQEEHVVFIRHIHYGQSVFVVAKANLQFNNTISDVS